MIWLANSDMEGSSSHNSMERGRGVLRFAHTQINGADQIGPLFSTPIHTRSVDVQTPTVSHSCAVSDDYVQLSDLNSVPMNLINNIVKQLGTSIGQNIVNCL